VGEELCEEFNLTVGDQRDVSAGSFDLELNALPIELFHSCTMLWWHGPGDVASVPFLINEWVVRAQSTEVRKYRSGQKDTE